MSDRHSRRDEWICSISDCKYRNSPSTKYCDRCDARRRDRESSSSSYWKCRGCGKLNKDKYKDCGKCKKLRDDRGRKRSSERDRSHKKVEHSKEKKRKRSKEKKSEKKVEEDKTKTGEEKESDSEDLKKYSLDVDCIEGGGMSLADRIRAIRQQQIIESDCSCSCSGGNCSCEE
uniref:RanBP2-type domain-containing protein n=1 Tax=Parastrongyloides trichosuri TaxID=131310 RepID=A0A0N4Z3J3_PARTI